MQGSRHERAALVGVAYFIGALTVFIWYSAPEVNSNLLIENTQSASLAQAIPEETIIESESLIKEQKNNIRYSNGVLEVEVLDGVRVLSFDPVISGIDVSADFESQGTHTSPLYFSASPSEEYVFFCEQHESTSETCRPFVYDVLADTIYPLRKDGERVDLLTSAAGEVSWQDNALVIENEIAKDPRKPWQLGY